MRITILRFSDYAAPLYTLLEAAFRKEGKRKKRPTNKLNFRDLGCTELQSSTCASFHKLFQILLKNAYWNQALHIRVLGDTNDVYWAGVVSIGKASELNKPISVQEHILLAVLSAPFSSTQEH